MFFEDLEGDAWWTILHLGSTKPKKKKRVRTRQVFRNPLPYSSPEAHRIPGQPYDYVSDNICWKKQGWVEQGWMPTKHHTNPHQPNERREGRLALDEVLQKDVTYPIRTTPTGEVALGTGGWVYISWLDGLLIIWIDEPFSCEVFAITKKVSTYKDQNWNDDLPKSRFSRIRTMRTPGTLSSASGFSRIGFHRSVPGIRPYKGLRCCHERKGSSSSYQNGHPRPRGTVHNHKQRYNHADHHTNFDVPDNREEEC